MSLETLKLALKAKIGEPVVYSWEVVNVLDHLGSTLSRKTVSTHLRPQRVPLQDHGIDPYRDHKVSTSLALYPVSKVWDYLQGLEVKGKIKLEKRGISSFERIVELEYTRARPMVTDPERGRIAPHAPLDDPHRYDRDE